MRKFLFLCLFLAIPACRKQELALDMRIRTSEDGRLMRAGREIKVLGVNVYSLASSSDPKKFGCGTRFDDAGLEDLFKEVVAMVPSPYVPAIRFWAYQSFTASGKDFSRIDRIVALAKKHHVLLIPVLEDQWHYCSRGGYRLSDWYLKDYRKPYAGYERSLRAYAAIFAGRYKNVPEILMLQVMNEAETRKLTGGADTLAMLGFAIDMSTLIKSVDPVRLVSLGTFGGDRGSIEGSAYPLLHSVEAVDVVEAHDYTPYGYAQTVRDCIETARQLKKPCMIGEIGLPATDAASRIRRALALVAKVRRAFDEGASVVLLWSYRAGDGHGMEFDRQDPIYDMIRTRIVTTVPAPP